ncbi:hypothetical protein OHB26_23235 [Nocardia sp. NBC_01503]|uniref:hypothetical protein n=1 Tax=Nocardia sp. NBC_01503 TaxID=2975997 RepID=UPI002E7B1D04|nr:hypothetical protein [Nocardia sp. NBC_01503]WTL29871.1 hypothetical protein OHB26_23235 [Nocardia sp. NBC_01503]
MRTVISEFDTIGSDFGFDSLPWELRAEPAPVDVAEATWQPVMDRRPCRARVRPVSRDRARVGRPHVVTRRAVGRPLGAHPLNRVQRAQIGFAALAITALMTALAVAGLVALAQLRSGEFGAQTTSVVDVVPAPAH